MDSTVNTKKIEFGCLKFDRRREKRLLHTIDANKGLAASFDNLGDKLGLNRTEFPHTLYMAEKAPWNSIGLFKISNVSGKRRDVVPKTLVNGDGGMEDEDDEDEDSDSDEESVDGASSVRRVAHQGCFNRIRAMPQNPHICVTWADYAHVQVWDMSIHLNALAESETEGKDGTSPILNRAPLVNFSGHKDEGYAIDWSPATAGRLLSGDCMSMIHLWEPASGSWTVDPIPLAGHTASVEDIQWSPSEAKWGSRLDYLSRHITQMLASCMLASGSDDGTFSIHDLRVIKDGDKDKVAHFEYHKHPITSIEWSAHESSTLAVSSGDNQLT
ncbi:hypothetical protein F2Q70_00029145 [Brassica cretica]|nr:hypothetical protein F2Q70_00029145 [Brassica cretica]